MIKMLRVDHRLLHGQVGISWKSALDIDCILIANDKVPADPLRKQAVKMAKPEGVKLVIKNIDDSIISINSGVTDKYKLFIVVETIDDAARLCRECGIKSLNLGGTKYQEGARSLSKVVSVNDAEAQTLKALADEGVDIEIRMVPGDPAVKLEKVL